MPTEKRRRTSAPLLPGLDLPPPFRPVALREVGDAFAHARKIATEAGAGTLVHVGRFDLVEFAVVLEPEEPLGTARRVFYAGMNALGDALLAHAPPERPITFGWPDEVRVDGGIVGGAQLAWPEETPETETPPWLVFGATIRTFAMGEAGRRPVMALEDEGFEDLGAGRLVESFARHLMLTVDIMQSEGFEMIARSYLQRLDHEKGAMLSIADNGDLLVRWRGGGEPEIHSLSQALASPSWLDPATGGPRS